MAEEWREKRGAVRAGPLLDAVLARADAEGGEAWRLAVFAGELRSAEGTRVFGEAAVGGGCAVLGLGGLDRGRHCTPETSLERAVKVAVHELGHASGLAHCADPRCVMYPSRHVGDTDRKARSFCRRCREDFLHVNLDAARG